MMRVLWCTHSQTIKKKKKKHVTEKSGSKSEKDCDTPVQYIHIHTKKIKVNGNWIIQRYLIYKQNRTI